MVVSYKTPFDQVVTDMVKQCTNAVAKMRRCLHSGDDLIWCQQSLLATERERFCSFIALIFSRSFCATEAVLLSVLVCIYVCMYKYKGYLYQSEVDTDPSGRCRHLEVDHHMAIAFPGIGITMVE